MVKMAKLDANKKPIGTPVMVKAADIASKQKMGLFVVGESKEEKKTVHCSQCGKGFSNAGVDAKYKTGFSHCKDHKGMRIIAETASAGASSAGSMGGSPTGFARGGIGMQQRSPKKKKPFAEAGFNPNVSTATTRAQAASRFSHDPDRAAPMYKANKYNPETGLGGYIAPRGDTTDKSNILIQLKANLDTATGKPLTFQDGSTLEIRPSIARAALAKIDQMRPAEKHEAIINIMKSKDAFVSFVKRKTEGGPADARKGGHWETRKTGQQLQKYWVYDDVKEGWFSSEPEEPEEEETEEERRERIMHGIFHAVAHESADKNEEDPKFTGYWKGKDKGKPGKKMVGGD
jgi:hypothetical protein